MAKGQVTIVCSTLSVVLLGWQGALAQVLLMRRTQSLTGILCEIAGGIERQETAWKVALREVKEEIEIPLKDKYDAYQLASCEEADQLFYFQGQPSKLVAAPAPF